MSKSIEFITCQELPEEIKMMSEFPYVEVKGYYKSRKELEDKIVRNVMEFLNRSGTRRRGRRD